MDVNEIKKNSEAERDGNYDHILVSMLGIGGGFECNKEENNHNRKRC
jgi:hypothetical protein